MMSMPKTHGKSFVIPKLLVWEAWRQVKANKGAPGVDGQDLEQFETDLRNNLYRVWNRMSSGTWFPPPVRAVEILKPHGGGVRMLGVPTIRVRCWKYDWAIDLDVQKFFDEVPWDLVIKAVQAVTDSPWVLLYVKRWLQAPLKHPDGTLEQRSKGTPQGSAVSPILANLFMHYAFDQWMARECPGCPFERFADDAIVHCASRHEAQAVLARLTTRMSEVGLRLHPDKTRIVYCKDSNRRDQHEHTSFTFLGYAFRPRQARNKNGVIFTCFLPAISPEALKAKSRMIRRMRIHRHTRLTLDDLARWLNPIITGWMNYYGRYRRTAMRPLLERINLYLRRWAGRKYKRLRAYKRFKQWRTGIAARQPRLFAHWQWVAWC